MTAHRARALFAQHGPALIPGAIVVGLMIVWAIHDGGYDADTWYWGALLALATLAVVVVAGAARAERLASRRRDRARLLRGCTSPGRTCRSRGPQSPGDALQGSNRALLYLIVFALLVAASVDARGRRSPRWSRSRSASARSRSCSCSGSPRPTTSRSSLIDGRLAAPTGYFNASVALFIDRRACSRSRSPPGASCPGCCAAR